MGFSFQKFRIWENWIFGIAWENISNLGKLDFWNYGEKFFPFGNFDFWDLTAMKNKMGIYRNKENWIFGNS